MFDKLKAMGAVAGLLKNQDKIKDAIARVKSKSEATRVTGVAGGGACRVVVSGAMRVVSVELTPALVSGMAADPKTRDLAGMLIAEATNDGLMQAQKKLHEAIEQEAREMGIPELSAGLRELV
ncbi:MAG: YbaB/EbfC family nucleoid-associated protein [Planctomycetota bacterium]|nr:YbaB/EbfC family nucleoid-associated protein [Planctomycetota bacterium]